jgi:hypothetical protein
MAYAIATYAGQEFWLQSGTSVPPEDSLRHRVVLPSLATPNLYKIRVYIFNQQISQFRSSLSGLTTQIED